MNHLLASFALLALAAVAPAQTTGVPGLNDLRVNFMGSSTTSCNTIPWLGVGPLPVVFDVSCPPGTITIFAVSASCLNPPIPLTPTAPVPCGGPLNGTPPTNLWWSLSFPILLTIPAASNSAGQALVSLPLPGPLPPMSAAVQAIIPSTCSPLGVIFSQAHTFSWN